LPLSSTMVATVMWGCQVMGCLSILNAAQSWSRITAVWEGAIPLPQG